MVFVYVLRCGDGTFYTGFTRDLFKRLEQHSSGKGAKYTRSRLPLELVYCEVCADIQEGMRREAEIKSMNKDTKLRLMGSSDKALLMFMSKEIPSVDMGSTIREVSTFIDGKGGGRADHAQAGGSNAEGVTQALERAKQLVIDILGGKT